MFLLYYIGGNKIIFYDIVLSALRWLENSDHDGIIHTTL